MEVAIMYYRPHYLQKTIHLFMLLSLVIGAARAVGEPPQLAQVPVELGGSEKFVPGGDRFYSGATLELKGEINVIGEEVKLRQVARWADGDKAAFEPIADLVLFRLSK